MHFTSLFRKEAALAMAIFCSACSAPNGSSPAGSSNGHLRCAGIISAADKLMRDGSVTTDPKLAGQTLLAMMTHLNAYSIPKQIEEQQAFADLKIEVGNLLSSLEPSEIIEEAGACVKQAKSVLER